MSESDGRELEEMTPHDKVFSAFPLWTEEVGHRANSAKTASE